MLNLFTDDRNNVKAACLSRIPVIAKVSFGHGDDFALFRPSNPKGGMPFSKAFGVFHLNEYKGSAFILGDAVDFAFPGLEISGDDGITQPNQVIRRYFLAGISLFTRMGGWRFDVHLFL